jgi:hypothetical protein
MQHITDVLSFAFILYMFSTCGTSVGATLNKRSRAIADANIWRYLGLLFGLALIVSLIGGAVLDAIHSTGIMDSVRLPWAISGVLLGGIALAAVFPRSGKTSSDSNA